MDQMKQTPTVFISYNWGSDDIAQELEDRLQPCADVKRDKSTVKAWGDLTEFMNSIRDQDFAVLIISNAYLKSEACLYEVMQLMKEQQWDKRVMYIVTEDARDIYDTTKQLAYIRYWAEKEERLKKEIQKYNPAAVTTQAEELKKVQLIALNIGEFLSKVKQTNNPNVEDAMYAVIERIGGVRSSETVHMRSDEEPENVINLSIIKIPTSLRVGWNFHNDIALRLEMKARSIFGDKERPYTKIYDADAIESGRFAEVMIAVLHGATDRENDREEVEALIQICSQLIGQKAYQIDSRVAQGLLNRLMELIG